MVCLVEMGGQTTTAASFLSVRSRCAVFRTAEALERGCDTMMMTVILDVNGMMMYVI